MNVYAFSDEAGNALEVQVAALKRNGLQGMELRNLNDVNVADMTNVLAKQVRSVLDDNDLIVWSMGSPIGKTVLGEDIFSHECDRLKRIIENAHILGAQRIRMFSFYPRKETCMEENRNEVMDRLHAFAEIAADGSVMLCHENEKGIYGDIAIRCLDIVTEVPQIRNIFDPANYIQSGQETWEAWQMLKTYTEYLHIKDALEDGTVMPSGEGVGHLPEILKEFTALGGKNVTIEPHLKTFDALGLLEEHGIRSGIREHAYPDQDTAFDAAVYAYRKIEEAIHA